MLRPTWSWSLGLLLLACPRVTVPTLSAGVEALKSLGQDCAEDGECSSGICQDATCCRTRCEEFEACNLDVAPGTCTARRPGDACSRETQCSHSYCRDGVCCDIDCQGRCLACNVPGKQGQCSPALDNTDPHGDCESQCQACFGRDCFPALPDTDPHGRCGAEQTCSVFGDCRQALGTACTLDGQCASNTCMATTCLELESGQVNPANLAPGAQHRSPFSLAFDSSGQLTMALVEKLTRTEDDGTVAILEDNAFLARQGPDGWTAHDLGAFPFDPLVGHVMRGVYALVVVDTGQGCGSAADAGTNDDCGVLARWVGTSGTSSVRETIMRYEETVQQTQWLYSAASADGSLVAVAFAEGTGTRQPRRLRLALRPASSNHWQLLEPLHAANSGAGLLEFLDGHPVVLDLACVTCGAMTRDQLVASAVTLSPDGGPPAVQTRRLDLGPLCPASAVDTAPLPGSGGLRLTVVLTCDPASSQRNRVYRGTLELDPAGAPVLAGFEALNLELPDLTKRVLPVNLANGVQGLVEVSPYGIFLAWPRSPGAGTPWERVLLADVGMDTVNRAAVTRHGDFVLAWERARELASGTVASMEYLRFRNPDGGRR